MKSDPNRPTLCNAEAQEAQIEFIKRGLSSGKTAKQSGKYVAVSSVLHRVAERIANARKSGA